MKKLLVLLAMFAFASPALGALAHGGVSKMAGSNIVYLNQNPLSPFTGEAVTFSFKITDKDNKPLAGLPVSLKLIRTFYGDPTKDKELETQNFTTDANGDFAYIRAFYEPEYFDLDLSFEAPGEAEQSETGFLVQVREQPEASSSWPRLISIAIGVFVGSLILRAFQKK